MDFDVEPEPEQGPGSKAAAPVEGHHFANPDPNYVPKFDHDAADVTPPVDYGSVFVDLSHVLYITGWLL